MRQGRITQGREHRCRRQPAREPASPHGGGGLGVDAGGVEGVGDLVAVLGPDEGHRFSGRGGDGIAPTGRRLPEPVPVAGVEGGDHGRAGVDRRGDEVGLAAGDLVDGPRATDGRRRAFTAAAASASPSALRSFAERVTGGDELA